MGTDTCYTGDMSKVYSLATPDAAVLNAVAKPVPRDAISSPEIKDVLRAMLQIAEDRQGDASKPTVVGLAAPQIGAPWRIILVDLAADGSGGTPRFAFFINPTITAYSDEKEDGREGCWSTDRVCGIVPRAKRIFVEADDLQGNRSTTSYEGFVARVFQHEVDHLHGIRFPDRITNDAGLHWVEPEAFGDYRKRWKSWDVPCPRERWLAIKTGRSI